MNTSSNSLLHLLPQIPDVVDRRGREDVHGEPAGRVLALQAFGRKRDVDPGGDNSGEKVSGSRKRTSLNSSDFPSKRSADALVEASFEGKRHTFLVEIDRGTTTYARMKRKFIGYHRWWQEHGPFIRFGVANLRLLVFTSSEARLKVLRRSIEEHIRGGAGFIWLALLEEISISDPEKLLSPIWHCARRGPITVKPGRVVKVDPLFSLFACPPGLGAPS